MAAKTKPWQVTNDRGIFLPQIGWHLDAHSPTARSFISHAHFDHMADHQCTLCSTTTARLLHARRGVKNSLIALDFGQPYSCCGETTITLHPAGHVFGSALWLAENENGRLLYTGDFKLRHGLSAEPCATPQADVLIMETTYGLPRYVFPPAEETIAAIVHFCRQTLQDGSVPVLLGYSLGKAQELLCALSSAGLPIMLHPQTYKLTKVYQSLGVAFPAFRPFSLEARTGHVVIGPPQVQNSNWLRNIEPRRVASISGWSLDPGVLFQQKLDAGFPLSDHADFTELLRFVELVQPKLVYTVHGFAREFAQILRRRGVEAWALGLDNQLELEIDVPAEPDRPLAQKSSNTVTMTGADPAQSSAEAPLPASLGRLAQAAEAVRTTNARLEKLAVLQSYLLLLPVSSTGLAALYLTGRPFPQVSGRSLGLGWAQIRRGVLEITGLEETEFRHAYRRFSDLGETVESLLHGHTHSCGRTLEEVAETFAAIAASATPQEKISVFSRFLRTLSPLEARYFVKIVTGDLRIGLKEGMVEEALAAVWGPDLESVRQAHMICGDIARTAIACRTGQLNAIRLQPFCPFQFMLASPEPDAAAIVQRLGETIWAEDKYDGIRCQIHKSAGRVEIYSRDLRCLTGQFPEIALHLRELTADVLLDGELLAWKDGRPRPFTELQKRLGRDGTDLFMAQEWPVRVQVYDLLWLNGKDLLNHPLRERRSYLAQLNWPSLFGLAPVYQLQGKEAVDMAFLQARQNGNEGLVCKDPQSTYSPGRRGHAWLKLKKTYASLDVVVVGAEYGHGRRRNVLSDYTFAVRDDKSGNLSIIGKAYRGLTDAEIEQLTAHFLETTIEIRGRFHLVEPQIVLEVGFDAIQPSQRHQSGFALRFPRILRIRSDKTPAEIDSLSQCARLAQTPLRYSD